MSYGSGSRDAHLGDDRRSAGGLEPEPCLRVYMLGRFDVYADGRPVIDESWSRSRAKAILKLLAVERRSLKRDQVIEILWPGSDAAAGANSLRQSLHHLRSAFVACGLSSPVAGEDESLSLSEDIWTDVGAFRSAARAARASRKDILLYEKAVDLYGGDLLPHDVYEDWSQHPRDELKALHLRLLSELADLCRCDGRCETAEELLLRVLQADPMREEEHRMLMRVYMHCGRRAEAVRQYQLCRDILSRELGVDPSAETEALYREIVSGDQAGLSFEKTLTAVTPLAPVVPPDPEIRYATTSDGVRIAYAVHPGPEPPLVVMPALSHSHLTYDWLLARQRRFWQMVNKERRLVRYDSRGSGMSKRNIVSFSLEDMVADLEAVVAASGAGRFALYASGHMGPAAITFAVRHPQQVARLVLYSCYASGTDFMRLPGVHGMRAILEESWDMYVQAVTSFFVPASDPDSRAGMVHVVEKGMDQDALARFVDAIPEFSAVELLSRVTCPTLVLHRANPVGPWPPEFADKLAAGIPGAELMFVDGTSLLPWAEDEDSITHLISDFLSR